MQIAEDAQMIFGHMIMQWLYAQRGESRSRGELSAVWRQEKYLILGSNSFSGATFVDYLAAQGPDVLATSRSAEPHAALVAVQWHKRPGHVRFERIDINHDLDELDALLKRERPTHVVNFAAQSMVGESWHNPDHWMRPMSSPRCGCTNCCAATTFWNATSM